MNKFLRLVTLVLVGACAQDRSTEIDKAMKNYDRHILHMDADSIALSFLPDGKTGGEGQPFIVGQDSIRNFLRSFQGVGVLEQHSNTVSIAMNADSAVQKGTYMQIITFLEKGDTLELGGQFEAVWVDDQRSSWRLRKMYTSGYTNKKYVRFANP